MERVATLFEPAFSLIGEKLGRCAYCMRLSALLTAGAWLLFFAAVSWPMPQAVFGVVSVATVFFTVVSLAHAVAYVVREPLPAGGCTPCQQKARERARVARRRRRWAWLKPRPANVTRAPRSSCRTCPASRPIEEMIDILPTADADIRPLVEAAPEYQFIAARVEESDPTDTWRAEMRHHFVYRLGATAGEPAADALFVVSWDTEALISAAIITPAFDGGEPRVQNIRELMAESAGHITVSTVTNS